MAPKGRKGMEIEVAGKSLKSLRKGTKGASSLVAKKEAKYASKNGTMRTVWHLSSRLFKTRS
ncbi:hypothetical protein HAX54_024860, partial [Datura stramonium]|nr:hypothetical protein [Datura stramonium]